MGDDTVPDQNANMSPYDVTGGRTAQKRDPPSVPRHVLERL